MSSMLELLIHQQEVRAKTEAMIAEQRAEMEARLAEQRAVEAEQTRAILMKMARILSGNESTESPMVNMEKTSYIGVETKKTSYIYIYIYIYMNGSFIGMRGLI